MRHNHLLILGTCAFAFVTGCNRQPPAASGSAPVVAPVVSVVKPEKRPIKRVVEQPGSVQAFEETQLLAKFPGYIKYLAADPDKASRPAYDRLIDIGSRVKMDQVLAELSVPELDEEFKQKEAQVRQYEAEVTQSQKALAAWSAGIVASKALVAETKASLTGSQAQYERWQLEITRVTRLVANGVIGTQTRDETLSQFKSAEADRTQATAKVASAEAAVVKAEADRDKAVADVVAVGAKLDVAKADVRRVDALRGYTRIKAPFDGIVTRRAANTGDFVMADGKHGLFTVARIDPVRVVVNVPEADAGLVNIGQEVRVTLQAVPGPAQVGKIVRTSWSLDPGSRTLRAEVDLPNAEAKVRPGMYVYARLTAELPAEWSVPVVAVGKVSEETVIYLVENGKAVRVAVQLIRGDSQFTQIRRYKRAGTNEWTEFTGGESVATPAAALKDGQAIP